MSPIKILLYISLILLFALPLRSQDMTLQQMEEIIISVADSVIGESGVWQFKYNDIHMLIMTDVKYNRMRIISPIVEQSELDKEQMVKLLEANYHSALDVKYALSDDVLWSVFIHPLRELTKNQLINALSQVYNATLTFGSSYSSTGLFFGGNTPEKDSIPSKKN